MSRSIAYTIATILIVLMALLAAPFFIPWAKYKDVALTKVAEKTGYVVTVSGDVSGGILPMPHVSLNNVAVATSASAQPFVQADHVAVSLAFAPLLRGEVAVGSVELVKPVVRMSRNASGGNNWTATPANAAPAPTVQTAPETAPKTEEAKVSIGTIRIQDGDILFDDAGKKTAVTIGELSASVPSLSGPFRAKGALTYNAIPLYVDGSVGDVRKDNFDVDAAVAVAGKALEASLKGTLATKPELGGQLSVDVSVNDTAALTRVGIAIPAALQGTQVKGMLDVNGDSAHLTKGSVSSPMADAKIDVRVVGIKAANKQADMDVQFTRALDIDALLKALPKGAPETAKQAEVEKQKTTAAAFLPSSISIPAGLDARVKLSAPAVSYKKQQTGALQAAVTLAKGGNLTARVSLDKIPGGGAFSGDGALRAASVTQSGTNLNLNKPTFTLAYSLQASSLKTLVSDWLQLAKADVFNVPNVPKALNTKGTVTVAGAAATVAFDTLSFADTNMSGAVSYAKSARPVLSVALRGDHLTIGGGTPKTSAAGVASSAAATAVNPPSLPQLPFDVVFDVSMGQLKTPQIALSDIVAKGRVAGQGVTLTQLSAKPAGGAVSVAGRVADVSKIAGVDLAANFSTPDVRSFVAGLPAKVALPDSVSGAVDARVKLQGDRTDMKVNAGVTNRGLTVSAAGTLSDLLNPVLPGSLAVHIAHQNFAQAMRLFAPTWPANAGGGGALDITANVKLSDGAYDLSDLKAKLGTSDLSGNLSLATKGAMSVSGKLSSSTLAVGDLLGVRGDPKTAMRDPMGQSPYVILAAAGGAPWSSAQLPVDALRKFALDLDISARTLTYGTWVLTNASFPLKLSGGKLSVAPMQAGLFGGNLNLNLSASAPSNVLSVALSGDAKSVQIGPFLSALMSQSTQRARGAATVGFDLKGAGASSLALVQSLNGKIDVATQDMSVLGIDLEKLGQGVDAALGGSGWQDALTGGLSGFGLDGGSTGFKDVSHTFPVSGGVLGINDLKMETRSGLVRLASNGQVNFPSFVMDVDTQVYAVKASKAVAGITLSGPLNAPQKNVDSTALRALVGNKVQKQLDKVIGSDKVQKVLNKAPGLGALVEGLSGGAIKTAPKATTETTAPAAATDSTQPQTAAPAPAPAQDQPTQKPVEQQVIEGLFNQLGK